MYEEKVKSDDIFLHFVSYENKRENRINKQNDDNNNNQIEAIRSKQNILKNPESRDIAVNLHLNRSAYI